ncbi:MAG: cobalamin-binding protein [Acidobacteriota bacterium]
MTDLRIVSLLPSATEIICALGLEAQLVGVTHECDYPPSVRNLPKVTHTLIPTDATSQDIDQLVRERLKSVQALYTLNLPVLEVLQPDVIVTQALCDVCAVAEEEVRAAACHLPGRPQVINLEPQTLEEVLASLYQVAAATGRQAVAEEVVGGLRARVETTARRSATVARRPRVALLEWLHPPFSCGHWSPELVSLAGGEEVLGRAGVPSRTLSWEEVAAAAPEVIFVACCGFSVERTMEDLDLLASHPVWASLPAVRQGRIYVTDGSHYFSRPGPRLVESLEILAHALHPALHPRPTVVPAVEYRPKHQFMATSM